jgi:cob(I)alamin adenosyltransferase
VSPVKGLVIVNTGNGKGKTTAALGLMLRAWGNGLRVIMLQFVKSPDREYGEHKAARRIGIEILALGGGFVFDPNDEGKHRSLALEQWEAAKQKIRSGDYDMVVLDELTYPVVFGWIPAEEVIDILKNRPDGLHVVITGRGAPQSLVDFADTVVDMTDVKHHFRSGVKAQRGIEL